MVKARRHGFGLTGPALEDFVRQFIVEMVAGGADPVVGNRACSSGWSPTIKHGANPANIANSLIGEWLVQCATLFCTYVEVATSAALARVTLARMSVARAVQMNGLGSML